MKEKMPKKSGRWWFWRKRADSTIKQVCAPNLKKQKRKTPVSHPRVRHRNLTFIILHSQSETKLETKEGSHLEEEGPSMSQEKLPALP